MAVYERGPRWLPEKNVFDQPTMREHVAHHEALGPRLLAAGPLQVEGTDTTVGVVLLIATSPEEAAKWLADDPAVKAQVMMGKIREWRVSKIQAFSRETAPSR
ncbi:MAG TPA: YciI family protein [Thermoanaerobaculia bacterium]|jgi:uncharacterized protein YciI|nr:YciI family protein [Thermoanaerobaculia bacterium]